MKEIFSNYFPSYTPSFLRSSSCGGSCFRFPVPAPSRPCSRNPCHTIRITGPCSCSNASPTEPVTGQGTPLCRADLYIDGRFSGSVCIDVCGNWLYQPPVPWNGGRHCVRAVLRCPGDYRGNPPEDTSCFCVAQGTEIHITSPQNGGSVNPGAPVIGTGEPGCEVELYRDGIFVGRVFIDPSGRWVYQPPVPWETGTHCVRAILRCACACPPPLEDTSCFEVPGIQITGPEDGGSADPEDPVTGTGEPGCEAELFVDGVSVGRVPIDANGNWIYEPNPPWTQGRHCVLAVLRCPAGNDPNPPRDETCFDVIYPACPPPPIDLPELNEVIASSRPSIAGRGIPGSQVLVCVQNSLGATVFCETAALFEDGEWGVQTPTDLPDGTYTVVATQLGALCNPTDASRTFSIFTVDTSFLNVNLISLVRGPVFRTVDMVMTGSASPDTTLSIYYLLLTPGEPVPTAEEVIGYSDPVPLTTGNAVRGRFARALTAATQTFPFTLTGKENITPLPMETGVMDGFNYNVYVVGVTSEGRSTGVLTLFESAIGMPFATGNGIAGDPFFVRMCTPAEMAFYPDLTQGYPGNRAGVTENARILDNIEGMQVLYDQTGGVHGMPDSLSLTYSLDSAFDLANYSSAWGGNGWRPIGNVDIGLITPPLSGEHVFTGIAGTPQGGTVIDNLTINAAAAPQNPVLVRGLFGQVRGVILERLTLTNAFSEALFTGFADPAQTGRIGTLVGYMQGGAIRDITLTPGRASGGRSGTGSNIGYIGGMAGVLEGAVTVERINAMRLVTAELTSFSVNAGGLIGLLNQAGATAAVSDVTVTESEVTGSQNQGGVIGLVSAGLNQMSNVLVGTGIFRFFAANCGGIIGMFACSAPSNLTNLVVTQIQINEPNPPATAAHQGGLIGFTSLTAPLTMSGGGVQSGAIFGNNRLGGAFGTIEVRTGGSSYANINCGVDVTGRAASMGGVIGAMQAMTGGGSTNVTNCHSSASAIAANGPSSAGVSGGFAGHIGLQNITPIPTTPIMFVTDCSATANVTATTQEVGGFVGRTSGARYLRCRASGNAQAAVRIGGFNGNTDAPAPADPQNPSLQFFQCQARGNVTSTGGAGSGNGTGGFSGNCAYGLIDQCFATGNVIVNAQSEVGSMVGLCANPTVIRDSYAIGNSSGSGVQYGALLGHGFGAIVSRCYASGSVTGASAVAGLAGALENNAVGAASMQSSIALGPSAVATNAGGVVHRVCGQLVNGATLAQNYASSAMTLLSGGVPVTPISDPNGLDGQSMDPSSLLAVITSLGWNTVSVWNTATIGTLGRPTLIANPEV